MSAYDPARWSDFALAQLGASAALLGLVFVGLSINLRDVVGSRRLVNRAAEAIIGLALAAEGGGGLYWWPPAIVVAFMGALANSWVLLIEILR